MPPQSRSALLSMMLERFKTANELRDFLYDYEENGVPLCEQIVDSLPNPLVDLSRYAHDTVEALLRRQLVTPLFLEALSRRAVRAPHAAHPAVLPELTPPPVPKRASQDPFAPFASYVGRAVEIDAVRGLLADGRSALLIGGRRTGKTALSHQLTAKDLGRRLAQVDIAAWPGGDEPQLVAWLGNILSEGAATCTNRDALKAVLRKLVPLTLVVDEAERLLGCAWTNPFLAWLRHLDDTYFGTDLSLLLIGGPELDRYRDEQDPTYPGGSPVLNTAETVPLAPLDIDACARLAANLHAPVDLALLRHAGGGHPWLLTQILSRMWHGSNQIDATNHVDKLCDSHVRTWRRQTGPAALALLLHELVGDGVEAAAFDGFPIPGRLSHLTAELITLRSMCVLDYSHGRIKQGPEIILRRWRRQG